MARKNKGPAIAWYDVASTARPLLLLTIEFLLRTKRLAPYGTALRLLSIAIDRLIPEGDDRLVVAAVRKSQKQLRTLRKAKPAKQRTVLTKLKDQVAEL